MQVGSKDSEMEQMKSEGFRPTDDLCLNIFEGMVKIPEVMVES